LTRVLVTGATGFVGSVCVRRLVDAGAEVHACARARSPGLPAKVAFHEVDLLEPHAATELVAAVRPARLLHLAWLATPQTYWSSAANDAWVGASVRLLEEFALAGGSRVVVAGTCAEYDWSEAGPYRELRSPLAAAGRYGLAKDALRRWTEGYARTHDVSVAWARLFFLYGPGEHPDRIVPYVATRLLAGEPAETTSGAQVRDYLHVDDAATALVALLRGDVEGPVNVASGQGVAIATIAHRLADIVGRPDLLRLGALETPGDHPAEIVADVARLQDEVGWRPSLTLDEGLASTVDWWRGRT